MTWLLVFLISWLSASKDLGTGQQAQTSGVESCESSLQQNKHTILSRIKKEVFDINKKVECLRFNRGDNCEKVRKQHIADIPVYEKYRNNLAHLNFGISRPPTPFFRIRQPFENGVGDRVDFVTQEEYSNLKKEFFEVEDFKLASRRLRIALSEDEQNCFQQERGQFKFVVKNNKIFPVYQKNKYGSGQCIHLSRKIRAMAPYGHAIVKQHRRRWTKKMEKLSPKLKPWMEAMRVSTIEYSGEKAKLEAIARAYGGVKETLEGLADHLNGLSDIHRFRIFGMPDSCTGDEKSFWDLSKEDGKDFLAAIPGCFGLPLNTFRSNGLHQHNKGLAFLGWKGERFKQAERSIQNQAGFHLALENPVSCVALGGIASRIFGPIAKYVGNSVARKATTNRIQKLAPSVKGLSPKQLDAVHKAHLVGRGEIGKDGINPAGLGNYRPDHIAKKYRILREAGISKANTRTLMEKEVAGLRIKRGVATYADNFGDPDFHNMPTKSMNPFYKNEHTKFGSPARFDYIVKYFSPQEKYLSKVNFQNGFLKDSQNRTLSTATDDFIYITDPDGFFVTPSRRGIHHSSINGGRPVSSAGHVRTNKLGQIVEIDNKSGHYAPNFQALARTVNILDKKGVLSRDFVARIRVREAAHMQYAEQHFLKNTGLRRDQIVVETFFPN